MEGYSYEVSKQHVWLSRIALLGENFVDTHVLIINGSLDRLEKTLITCNLLVSKFIEAYIVVKVSLPNALVLYNLVLVVL